MACTGLVTRSLKQARDELECSVGDMACTGLVTRAAMQARDELECAAGDMACTGLVSRALKQAKRDELECAVGDMAGTGVSYQETTGMIMMLMVNSLSARLRCNLQTNKGN